MVDQLDSLTELQLMARYNAWANARVYDCVAQLDDGEIRKDRDAFFGSIHATLNHIFLVDRLWSSRIMGEYSGIKSLDEILHDDLDALRKAHQSMESHLIRIVDRMAVGLDGGLNKEILYRTMVGGEKHASPARHIFLTLFNHQTHHRGQIHCMLTQAGVDSPPPLDVIFMIRELSEQAENA